MMAATAATGARRVMNVGYNLTARGSAAARVQRPQSGPAASSVTGRTKQPEPATEPAPTKKGLQIAIVHDWFVGGGAELVVEQLHAMFPDAPIYTSYCTREWRERLDGKVRTGVLQYWPFSKLRKYIGVLRIWWFTRLDFHGYDLVISSSGAEAKGIRVPPNTLHINYCHAPTHYYWSRYNEYMERPGFGMFDWLARFGLRTLVGPLRKWDYKAAQRPDYIIANSNHIKLQIQRYYDRSATVIYPPVYIERFQSGPKAAKRYGFVAASRQTPYKRIDLAVATCTRLGLPLTVIGNGPDHRRLRRMAGRTVTFLGKVSDKVVEEEFASAKALLFPGVEDFGITPVEALAAGTPVIAYNGGGAKEYVIPGKTGVLFDEQTVASLVEALRAFAKLRFDPDSVAQFSRNFSREQFERKMRLFIRSALRDSGEHAGS